MSTILTFQQFLQNPTGPYSAYFGRRADIKKDLNERFGKLLASGKISCYNYKDGDSYVFHVKIPSEKFSNMMYDVVIRLEPLIEGSKTDSTLLNYKVTFFSNSPAFVFTYAYVFNKDENLIPLLRAKIDPRALKEEPKVKNPVQIYGFEKSLYFGLLYIKYKNFHIKSNLASAKKLDGKRLLDSIRHSSDIMKEYELEKQREALKKKNEKKANAKNNRKQASEIKKQANKTTRDYIQEETNDTPLKHYQINKMLREEERKLEKQNRVIKPGKGTVKNTPKTKKAKVIKPKKKI